MKIGKLILPILFLLMPQIVWSAAKDDAIKADMLMVRITNLLQAKKEADALQYFEELEKLNSVLPESFYYFYIDALDKSGKSSIAYDRCVQYVSKFGRTGAYYAKVLPIYVRLDDQVGAERRQKEEQVGLERRQSEEQQRIKGTELRKLEAGMIRISGANGLRSFYIGKTEVTQGQWLAIMGKTPSRFQKCGLDCPVEKVSWHDVQEFIKKLNAETVLTYRLPTEQEWEYACRASKNTDYCGSDILDEVGWYEKNSGNETHVVGGKRPNAFGLFDMSGNVGEWTDSCWQGDCGQRILRGGSWDDNGAFAHAAFRLGNSTANTGIHYGFRLARNAP